MSPAKLATGFVSIALVLMAPGPARGQTCTSDADCGKGFRCQTAAPATQPAAPCFAADGGGCVAVSDPIVPTSSCQAAACASDADCGVDMVCNRQTSTTCTGTAPIAVWCDPNVGGCDAGAELVAPPVCTETVVAKCAYKWEVPCNADADCGTGFTCQPATVGTCTGSAGAPTAGGAGVGGGTGSAPPVRTLDAGPATTCTVVSSYPGRCQPKTITCASAGDCPAGWTCPPASPGTTTVAAPTAPVGVPVPAADPIPLDAGVAAPPVVATSICRAPSTGGNYGEWGGSDGTQTKGTVGLVTDGGTATGSNTPPTPSVPPSGGTQTSERQPGASTTSGGGCSVGSGADEGLTSALGVLALFALVALGRRRVSGSKR